MAKKNEVRYDDWTLVKGLKPVKIIGGPDRFSISVQIAGEYTFGINGCRIVDGSRGKFISFPAWKDSKKGDWHDIAFFNFKDDQHFIVEMFED